MLTYNYNKHLLQASFIHWRAKSHEIIIYKGKWCYHILMSQKYENLHRLFCHYNGKTTWIIKIWISHDSGCQTEETFDTLQSTMSCTCQEYPIEVMTVHSGQYSGQLQVFIDHNQRYLVRIIYNSRQTTLAQKTSPFNARNTRYIQ